MNKIYVTGDCHGNFRRFYKKHRPKYIREGDYVIVCGDLGLCWDREQMKANIEQLKTLPFTLLWVQGNHENYDLIAEFPIEQWSGGKVRHICRNKIILLERGQVFNILGKTFFTFGGARSHDISDGILDRADFINELDYRATKVYYQKCLYYWREKGVSWWEQELPNQEELDEGINNIEAVDCKIDYIITHCCSSEVEERLGFKEHDILTDYFNYFERFVKFKHWYFGHYHQDAEMYDGKHTVLYNSFKEIEE